jgi:NCS2 family nucleobase:cation symporter-2
MCSVDWTRRNRFILTASFAIGMAATLVPDWFSYVFTYEGNNHALQGLLQAVELVMANGFAVTGFLGLILNLLLPEDEEDEVPVVESDPEVELRAAGAESSSRPEDLKS